jgi:hypothetical protein
MKSRDLVTNIPLLMLVAKAVWNKIRYAENGAYNLRQVSFFLV